MVGAGLKGAPVIGRRYVLHVEDLARAFWTRHGPLELDAQASMEDMLDANKPMGMDLTYDSGEVEVVVRPVEAKPATPQRDIFDVIRSLPPGSRTKEDIDRQIAEERDSWRDR